MSAAEMYRQGLIGTKQATKLGILKVTKAQNSKMADFDGKGSKDEGDTKNRGVPEASTRHINKKQDMGSPARASGKPSKGGSVNATGQPVKRGQIDDASQQGPKFPAGARVRKTGKGTPKRLKGPIAKQGSQYGGGGRDTQ